MNVFHILKQIEKVDPEVFEKLSGRRQILKSFGSKVAAVALPMAFGSVMQKAYGKTTDTLINVLNFALELEYLEYNFYHTALSTGSNTTATLIPAADRAGFQAIEDHEKAHVNFLRTAIDTLGAVPFTPKYYTGDPVTGNPYTPASYDFTAGGRYPIYTRYDLFLKMANTFEDTGVRAYQGQIPELLANTNGIMVQALQITSVEARHAAYIRVLRRLRGDIDNPKPWITNNVPPEAFLQPFYLGEDNVIQNGLDLTTLTGVNGTELSMTAASEAFDEPSDKATIAALIKPFITA